MLILCKYKLFIAHFYFIFILWRHKQRIMVCSTRIHSHATQMAGFFKAERCSLIHRVQIYRLRLKLLFFDRKFLGARRKNWFDFVVYHQYLTFLLLFFGDQEIKFTLTGSDPVTRILCGPFLRRGNIHSVKQYLIRFL